MKIPSEASIFDGSTPTIVLTEKQKKDSKNIILEIIDFQKNIAQQICKVLHKHNLQSLIIEGGAKTINTFIAENIWDEAHIFTGSPIFGNGVKAPNFSKEQKANILLLSEESLQNDTLQIFKNKTT